jgi:A/G-specific adenine glycosylase
MSEKRLRTSAVKNKKLFRSKLMKWSKNNLASFPWRNNSDPYRILISEMLLRRTRASSVASVYDQFILKFPDAKTLAESDVHEIQNTIRPLGMISRAENLKLVASKIIQRHGDKFPQNEAEMMQIIGPRSRYAINAVRCFALNKHVPIFDVNVRRIFERVFSIHLGVDAHKRKESWELASMLLPKRNVKEYNWALLDLGRLVCTPARPHCAACPLNSICDYAKKNSKTSLSA